MYQVSKITTYDEDKLLYETYVGLTDKQMTLICSAFGKTEQESRNVANSICNLLNQKVEMESWESQLQPIIDEYKQDDITLSVIEVDRLTEIIRAKINLKEKNISEKSYENILNNLSTTKKNEK